MAPAIKEEINKNQNPVEQAASVPATISSNLDPMPHYIMSAACATAGAHAYANMRNPRNAGIAAGFSLAYLFAGRMLAAGKEQLGYDIGSITSLGLVGLVGGRAWSTGEGYSTALATAGGISSIANIIKSYQYRQGKPLEMHEKRV